MATRPEFLNTEQLVSLIRASSEPAAIQLLNQVIDTAMAYGERIGTERTYDRVNTTLDEWKKEHSL